MKIDNYYYNYLYRCRNKVQNLCSSSWKVTRFVLFRAYRYLLFNTNAFSLSIFYLLSVSLLGFGILKALSPTPRTTTSSFHVRNIDLFFTSVSAATVSSMMTVEMEVFSEHQLILMTLLMFLGGEIFTSMLKLHLNAFNMRRKPSFVEVKVESVESNVIIIPFESSVAQDSDSDHDHEENLKHDSVKYLGILVLCYILVVHILGVASVLVYLSFVSSAHNVLKKKGIKTSVFAVFTIVSTFANCGYIPTNENLIVFSKNSGFLLILIPQILLGNTLFPSALRVLIWSLGKRFKKPEAKYLLENRKEVGYMHLVGSGHNLLLAATGLGFLLIGFVLYSSLDWYSVGLEGMNTYERVVGIIFQCINTRHSGENIVDLATVAPAILVFFILMMYLPPYTSFIPVKDEEEDAVKVEGKEKKKKKKKRNIIVENLSFSQLSYIAMFIILICITERKSLKEDPINFSLLNIIFEVVSAYGNVGLTTGYSCDRRLRADPNCVSKWYGFAGKWTDEGKIVLILVMLFGKLKKFNTKGGRAWNLL